ncbi:MAG: hypothetical protein GC152_12795 [Alphaproteobacteria bacterium]|nr:hypothetical protein [Alphaproteobacteria bacterium]
MTVTEILYDDGVAETRVVLTVDGEPRGFHFLGHDGAHADRHSSPVGVGDLVRGRIASLAPGLDGAFIDIGDAAPGFVSKRRAQTKLVVGARGLFRVRRAGDGRKGPELDGDWRARLTPLEIAAASDQENDRSGPISLPGGELAACLRRWNVGGKVRVVVRDGAAASKIAAGLAVAGRPVGGIAADEARVWSAEIEDALDAALQRTVRFGNAVITIDETEAACMVDVDGAGDASAAFGGSGRDRLNQQAAAALVGELDRRGIAGATCVDFLGPSSPAARKALAAAARALGRVEDVGADGFTRIYRPHRGACLLSCASAPVAGGEWIRPGRRLTDDWRFRTAVRAVELALRRRPSARFVLALAPSLRERWLAGACAERLTARHGARVELGGADALGEEAGGRGYDVYER